MKINNTVKWILIVVVILAALALIAWGIKYYLDSRAPVPAPQPGGPPPAGNSIIDILGNLFTGNFFSNLFSGNKCDPDSPCYTKKGDYKQECCANNYNPNVNICNPNLCDPANPGYDQCGGFKIGC